jgi:hypothetical protein
LTGIFALLLWANLSSVALFLGVAFAAQLEAVRAGVPAPASADPLMVAVRSDVATAPGALSPNLEPGHGRTPAALQGPAGASGLTTSCASLGAQTSGRSSRGP